MREKACILCSEYEFRLSSQSLLRSFRLMESFPVIFHATRTFCTQVVPAMSVRRRAKKIAKGESSPNQFTILLLTLSCNSLTYLYKNSSKQHPQDIDTFTKQPRHPHRPTKWATASPRTPRAAPLPMGMFLPLLLPGIIAMDLEPRTISVTLQLGAFSTPILPIHVLGSTHLGMAFSLEMLPTQLAESSSKRNPMASRDSIMGHGLG